MARPCAACRFTDGQANGSLSIAPDTQTGTSAAALHLDCAADLHGRPDGQNQRTRFLLVEVVANDGHAERFTLSPLSALSPKVEYGSVGIDTQTIAPEIRAGCLPCPLPAGTHITMGTANRLSDWKILVMGDKILTAMMGVQAIRCDSQKHVPLPR